MALYKFLSVGMFVRMRVGLRMHITTALHTFNGLCSRTSRVSRYQKGKTSLDLNEARDDGVFGRQWHKAGPYANSLHLTPTSALSGLCDGYGLGLVYGDTGLRLSPGGQMLGK